VVVLRLRLLTTAVRPIMLLADHYTQFMMPEGYASAMLALAPCTVENGCLRVQKGSHKLGRLEHSQFGPRHTPLS
jgi:ectoine hydroxylase-related dioxygenase (phytanoyl-CoA dioxygenase family)